MLKVINNHDVINIAFSFSANLYDDPASLPIKEGFPLSLSNPYGRSKLNIEEILQDINKYDQRWNVAILRYFNPVGAHKRGIIGEDPNGIPITSCHKFHRWLLES